MTEREQALEVRRVADARRYASTNECLADLDAVIGCWSEPRVVGVAGLLIFATYATISRLTEVGAHNPADAPMLRTAEIHGREQVFLSRLLGLTSSSCGWSGGISNPRVMAMTLALGRRHARDSGMRRQFMDFLAQLIALSGLRVHDHFAPPLTGPARSAYWRYMTHSLALMEARIPSIDEATESCDAFVAQHTTPHPFTYSFLRPLTRAYPGYFDDCLELAHPATAAALRQSMHGGI